MIRGREAEVSLREQNGWIVTPNFEKLVLGLIEKGGWKTTSRVISLELQLARKAGRNQSFPPYFDPSVSQGVQEVLTQFEKRKLILHGHDHYTDVWVLTAAGQNLLRDDAGNKKPRIEEAADSNQRREEVLPKVRRKQEQKQDRAPEVQRETIVKQTYKIKEKTPPKKPKVIKQTVNKPPVETKLQQNDTDLILLKLTNEFKEAVKRLKKRRYNILIPLFREGDDGHGIQVYFSPKGYLCYRPKENEFVMDSDTALEIYGYEKISSSLRQALHARSF